MDFYTQKQATALRIPKRFKHAVCLIPAERGYGIAVLEKYFQRTPHKCGHEENWYGLLQTPYYFTRLKDADMFLALLNQEKEDAMRSMWVTRQ